MKPPLGILAAFVSLFACLACPATGHALTVTSLDSPTVTPLHPSVGSNVQVDITGKVKIKTAAETHGGCIAILIYAKSNAVVGPKKEGFLTSGFAKYGAGTIGQEVDLAGQMPCYIFASPNGCLCDTQDENCIGCGGATRWSIESRAGGRVSASTTITSGSDSHSCSGGTTCAKSDTLSIPFPAVSGAGITLLIVLLASAGAVSLYTSSRLPRRT